MNSIKLDATTTSRCIDKFDRRKVFMAPFIKFSSFAKVLKYLVHSGRKFSSGSCSSLFKKMERFKFMKFVKTISVSPRPGAIVEDESTSGLIQRQRQRRWMIVDRVISMQDL